MTDARTPRAKRRKAVTEAIQQASSIYADRSIGWHEQFEAALAASGYWVTRMKTLELRRRGQPESVSGVAGPSGAADLR